VLYHRLQRLNNYDFVINRFFMKLFKTTSMEIIQLCQTYLCFELSSVLLKNRTEKFRKKYTGLDIIILATIYR